MSQVQQVKDASDIVEIIGAHVDLKRSGTSLKGLCPFHGEKSPSFFVSETLQRYKCFGCGETGDVFDWLQKYDGLSFYESLQFLADRAGITLEAVTQSSEDQTRTEVLAVLNLASDYYHYLLTEHKAGEKARAYLKNRGVANDSIKQFKLGYSLGAWDGLVKYLHHKKKYPLALLEQAGLVIRGKHGRSYDRFRDRVMFPLKNHRGQVVGFSGRLLTPDPEAAKYINSPETIVYHKSKMLFGLSELYQHIREQALVVVVEGEFDVISSVQAHVPIAVAIKGSALTEEHVKLLSRTIKTILLALDTDAAGKAATKKAISIITGSSAPRAQELDLRVIAIPAGKDPDELIRANPKEWREAVKTSISAYEFLIRASLAEHDPQSPEGKRQIMEELAPVLGGINHAVELDFYVKRLAEALNVAVEVINRDIKRYQQTGRVTAPAAQAKPEAQEKPQHPRLTMLEEYLVFLLVHLEPRAMVARAQELRTLTMVRPEMHTLLQRLAEQRGVSDLQQLARSLPKDLQELLFQLYAHEAYLPMVERLNLEEELERVAKELTTEHNRQRATEITRQLGELDEKLEKTPEEIELQNRLLKEIVQLKRQG